MVGITGSVGAVGIHSLLLRLSAFAAVDLRAVMTSTADRYISHIVLSHILGSPVPARMYDPDGTMWNPAGLMQDRDAMLIAPATANMLGRLAGGSAGDLVSACYLNCAGPTLIAPVMNARMRSHPAVRRNLATLAGDGCVILDGRGGYEVATGRTSTEGGLPTADDVMTALRAACCVTPPRSQEVVVS
ncbi:flavoprotein [Actinoplanes sp. NPDC048967]|uniref:flavoprotein n=1 Tax=Actinoplanes sp. NPDC048967 TaxID=3155269 RepID=UPI0034081684